MTDATAPQRHDWDVIIVGGGAAGLSAALILGRARRRVLVIDAGSPRNATAVHMHGVLGRDETPPGDLLAAGRAELTRYDVSVASGTVTSATSFADDVPGFEVLLSSDERYTARRLLVATGLVDELPDIPGLADQWGRGVFMCPYCDGWEQRGRRVAVLGTARPDPYQAQLMRQVAGDVTFLADGATITERVRGELDARDIALEPAEVERVLSDETGQLTGIRFADGTERAVDVLFVAPKSVPSDAVLRHLSARTMRDQGVSWTLVDDSGQTSVRGLYAAGNVIGSKSSVPWAMASGSMAGTAINADLVGEDVRRAVAAAG
ncbi:NAD(P)/FAD-dependent oxidoreductase [Agromyces mangrovi Wang et al. 2018]|uniref:NAD(P)/FAD-dependent oxidoreductase n=1 Tax=Agromyces mangrovi TaxID=1858653 RepID=UPI0025726BB5|nr:NAD(P)/FAD-dependent oxidoreductase [Agromyces mangrovi]BDZ65488.1 thioredoxin reductase [Agromyces mangrovi]